MPSPRSLSMHVSLKMNLKERRLLIACLGTVGYISNNIFVGRKACRYASGESLRALSKNDLPSLVRVALRRSTFFQWKVHAVALRDAYDGYHGNASKMLMMQDNSLRTNSLTYRPQLNNLVDLNVTNDLYLRSPSDPRAFGMRPPRVVEAFRIEMLPYLHLATEAGDVDMAGNVDMLFYAADHADVLEMLLVVGADVDTRNGHGQTAVNVAAKQVYGNIVEKLLVDIDLNFVNGRDLSDRTALCYAIYYQHQNIVQMLLGAGVVAVRHDEDHHRDLSPAVEDRWTSLKRRSPYTPPPSRVIIWRNRPRSPESPFVTLLPTAALRRSWPSSQALLDDDDDDDDDDGDDNTPNS
ncbi:hypothetical protein RJ035_000213 [Blastomyces gilchristii]